MKPLLLIALCVAVRLLHAADATPQDVVKFSGLPPKEAAAAATAPPGFSVHLFAGEPDVRQPIAFCLDDRGRAWVAEGYTYPRRAPEGQGRDRIVVFEDTNGDHAFDKRTIFAENLNLVSGLEIGFGGVWVGAAPHLLFIPVSDWDSPHPAGEARVMLDGWDYQRDTHETLNTFTWGPDGWLYGCHGVFCPSFVGKPGTADADRQRVDAAVWRYHPTRHTFEVFAEGTSNPWGIDFDEFGECIIEACVIPHLWHMVQGGRFERQGGQHYNIDAAESRAHARYAPSPALRHVNPFIYDDLKTIADHLHYTGGQGPHAANNRSDAAGGGHAHAGLMVYLGGSWPESYRGRWFMNNIHGQRINMDVPERRGSGYVGKHGPDFINFNDRWSQVLNLLYDQNGSVYAIDWYDKNQCHHNDANGHDRGNGRIFKIVYGGASVSKVDLQKLSNRQLADLQLNKNDWYVRHARRILQERGADPVAHKALARTLKDNPDPTRQLRALWALHTTGGLSESLALAQLKKPNEHVRAWAIRLVCESRKPSAAALRTMERAARIDPSPFVRLYLYSALQRLDPADRWPIIQALVSHAEDASDHNLPLMAWFAAEPLVEADPRKALALASAAELPRLLNFTTRRAASIPEPSAQQAIVDTVQALRSETKQLECIRGWAEALAGRREAAKPAGWDSLAAKLASSSNPTLRVLSLTLDMKFGSEAASSRLTTALLDTRADAAVRRIALDALLAARASGLAATLQRLVSDAGLRSPALRALAAFDDPLTPGILLDHYAALNASDRRDAINTLASRARYARPLLEAIQAGRLSVKDLTADLLRQLRSLKDPTVNELLGKVYGLTRDSAPDKLQEVDRYKRIYRAGGSTPGDGPRGRAVFNKVCAQCHTLFDSGAAVGPDLTGSNRADLDYILQNIADPNAVIPNEYRSTLVEMRDDRVLTGIAKREDTSGVTLLTANETVTLPRGEIKSLRLSDVSMMPEGLLSTLSDQEIRDLLYYLGRPGQVPLPP